VVEEYRKFEDQTCRDRFTTLLKDCIFQLAAQQSHEIFLLVDAFDEFQTENERGEERRRLQQLLCELSVTQKVRLLITTRCHELDCLRGHFKNASSVEVKADGADIEKYIYKNME
jgi:hypothetical protein